MAPRIPKTALTGLPDSMIKRFGDVVPEPLTMMWHNPKVVEDSAEFGGKTMQWNTVDESLKLFAHMAVASQVGCGWCLDYGYLKAQQLDVTKASQVPRWRESDVFTPLERDVLEYAEAMTTTPPTVTDELSARLLDRLGPAAMVELTASIGFSNFSTRGNVALGVESQGFSATCKIPLAARPESGAASKR